MGAALVGGISICCIPMGGGGRMVITSFCALVISHKPCTDIASNLLAIELQLDVRIACNGLQQKFQHAVYLHAIP